MRLAMDRDDEERWISERLQALDHPVPSVSARDVMRAAGGGTRTWGRLAAGIALVLATTGLAFAMPGSPLRHWVARVVQSLTAAKAPGRTVASPPAAVLSQAGIAVDPGERFIVQLAPSQTLDSAIVWLTEGSEVTVRARGGSTTFMSDLGRLDIAHSGAAGVLEIQVPRGAPSVEIRSGSRRVWLEERSRVLTDTPPDIEGRYRLGL
jgi:hypothetical protein